MNTFKITYFEDGARTIVKEKIEKTILTAKELLNHSHVISVVEVVEEKPIVKEEIKEKPVINNKKKQ